MSKEEEQHAEAPAAQETQETPKTRAARDGKGYIDIDAPEDEAEASDNESAGSSIVESLDSCDEEREPHGGWPEDPVAEDEDEIDEEDLLEWGVEDEDWELADGGE